MTTKKRAAKRRTEVDQKIRDSRARINKIEFPIYRVTVKGALRHHVHEFPHSPGGEVEKMGRHLYEISMSAFFHDLPFTKLDEEYPNLYPNKLTLLQLYAENQVTAPLVIPNLGTINAVCTSWQRTFDFATTLSGEVVEFAFIEEQDRQAIFDNVRVKANIETKAAALTKTVREAPRVPKGILEKISEAFRAIDDAVHEVLAVQGFADAAAQMLEAKLLKVIQLCQTANRLTELQAPERFVFVKALKEVWYAAVTLKDDLLTRRAPIMTYRVERAMSAAQVSTVIYGSADKAIEIMQLNPIEDAFAIPAGMELRYYAPA